METESDAPIKNELVTVRFSPILNFEAIDHTRFGPNLIEPLSKIPIAPGITSGELAPMGVFFPFRLATVRGQSKIGRVTANLSTW